MTENLTALEIVVLKHLWHSSNGNGHDFGITDEVPTEVLPSRRSLSGVISSLSKKGIITVHDAVTTDSGTFCQFTFDGDDQYEVAKQIGRELGLIEDEAAPYADASATESLWSNLYK